MNAQDLKNSILQLAVQGKLVEQRPEEGTAKELLKKIKAEKEQLIKDKKIKKEKPLPEITDEEKPFEIPESWEWVRLSELCDMYTGNSISDAIKKSRYMNICEGYDYIGTKDVQFSGKIDYENGVKIPYTDSFRIAKKNSILMCIEGGSAGRKIGILDRDVCFGNKLCMFNPLNMINRYVFYTLQSPTFTATFKEGM
ncbi:MAG: restriction endonuclease subunit S, partial [Lachnospiraceae bacterium]|nr:restriction endonuclease subunit S [Lachnospiraceae bacterium]